MAASTVIAEDSPFMLVTAVSHSPSDFAPCAAGLYCRVRRPVPAAASVFPHRTLQARQVQRRFTGAVSSSRPLTWPTSTLRSVPQRQHTRGPGGGQALARYLNALSVTSSASFRHRPRAGQVSPGRLRFRRRLLPLPRLRQRRYQRCCPASLRVARCIR